MYLRIMRIDVWELIGVNSPTHFIFLSEDLAKIGDMVLRKSRKQEINEIGFQNRSIKGEIRNGLAFLFWEAGLNYHYYF